MRHSIHGRVETSDVQGRARSPEARATQPSKPEPSPALVKGFAGLRAWLGVS
jgi:hypothetical protein